MGLRALWFADCGWIRIRRAATAVPVEVRRHQGRRERPHRRDDAAARRPQIRHDGRLLQARPCVWQVGDGRQSGQHAADFEPRELEDTIEPIAALAAMAGTAYLGGTYLAAAEGGGAAAGAGGMTAGEQAAPDGRKRNDGCEIAAALAASGDAAGAASLTGAGMGGAGAGALPTAATDATLSQVATPTMSTVPSVGPGPAGGGGMSGFWGQVAGGLISGAIQSYTARQRGKDSSRRYAGRHR